MKGLEMPLRLAFATALAFAAPALAQDTGAPGPVMLTVTGAVGNSNRGPVDPELDKLFVFNDVAFTEAHEFDFEALQALPQVTVRADFPAGGEVVEFTGPPLEAVLDAAGASGQNVTVQAIDGYAVEIPASEMVEKGAVLALARNGQPLAIGGLGPAQIVFPRAERDDLAAMPDDWWIWQIFHIKVE